VADLPEVIGLLHRADWTRLSLSAEVRFECDRDLLHSRMSARVPAFYRNIGTRARTRVRSSPSGRAALLIAPGARYRLERQGEDELIQGSDGQRRWISWWPRSSDRPPVEAAFGHDRPVPGLFGPQDLLDGHVVEVLGPVTVGGRDAIAITATPRAGQPLQLHDRIEAAVDAELGIVLRREETFEGQLLTLTELTNVTLNPPEAADPARYTAPPGSRNPDEPGEAAGGPDGKTKNVMDLAAGGLGALIKHAPHFPVHRADPEPEPAEAAMPSPDPDVLAAEDGSASDDLLYLLYRTGEPRDLAASMHEWRDGAVMMARLAQTIRDFGAGGFGSLIEAMPSAKTVIRADARFRISGPDRYRVDYTRRDDRRAARMIACDGERRWHVYQDRTVTAPAAPLRGPVAHLVDTSWLLRCRLSGALDITYRGRRARQLRVTGAAGAEFPGAEFVDFGSMLFFPVDAIVDAETGCLLRLISFVGDAPAAWWELDDISTEPGDPDDFRIAAPPGTRVVEETGNPFADYTATMPGLAGTAARTAVEAVSRTHSAVSAARSFLDDLRGQR
jgi:outer membrane lipoprotein-sorting protein